MIVKELKEILGKLPEDATVYVEADHGQTPEQQNYVCVALVNEKEYYLEYCTWIDVEESTDEYRDKANVVLIGA